MRILDRMSKAPRQIVYRNFDDVLADVEQLRRGYEKKGNWSLAMILDHLTKSMLLPFNDQAPWLPPPIRWVARTMIRRMVRSGNYPEFKLIAPKVMKPAETISEQAAYEEFRAAAERINHLTDPTIDIRPFGRLEMADFKQMQLIHAAHHLGFLVPRQV